MCSTDSESINKIEIIRERAYLNTKQTESPMSRGPMLARIDQEINNLQSEVLRILRHDLRSNDNKPNSPPSTSRQIPMINAWANILYGFRKTVPLHGSLILNLEPAGIFTILHEGEELGTGILNMYSDGYDQQVNTNPVSAAEQLAPIYHTHKQATGTNINQQRSISPGTCLHIPLSASSHA